MSDQVAFIVHLTAKEGRLEEMKEHLFKVVHEMSAEPDFINTWIHDSQSEPNTVVLYETWGCSSEYFISHHLSKAYRQAYEKLLPDLLAKARRIEFLDIIKSYPQRRAA
ncbi:putative quinol monooxygenase [Pseudomonas akapageensis]|uniref:putative quinol monooxygenase n=1 Tax=Pseudomonas akapageensis TaxID=2609961 RepID=UPI0014085E00|nr:antibiotic biosynthesis monooxygenase [Pseudomonas akapageensis]